MQDPDYDVFFTLSINVAPPSKPTTPVDRTVVPGPKKSWANETRPPKPTEANGEAAHGPAKTERKKRPQPYPANPTEAGLATQE